MATQVRASAADVTAYQATVTPSRLIDRRERREGDARQRDAERGGELGAGLELAGRGAGGAAGLDGPFRHAQQDGRLRAGQAVQHGRLERAAQFRRQPGQGLAQTAVLDAGQHLVFGRDDHVRLRRTPRQPPPGLFSRRIASISGPAARAARPGRRPGYRPHEPWTVRKKTFTERAVVSSGPVRGPRARREEPHERAVTRGAPGDRLR
jgi:hypothetical protein